MAKKKAAPVVLTTEGFTGDTLVAGQAFTIPAPDGVLTVDAAEDSGADINQGDAGDSLERPNSAAPEELISFSAGASVPGTSVAPVADLRSVRKVLDTLVFGCDSMRSRQEAAAPAIEILDRLIGA
jgi:hypothetical protein